MTALVQNGLTVFVPCRLTNPLNGSHGHWRTAAKRVKAHREATHAVIWAALRNNPERVLWEIRVPAATPKRVTFCCHVVRRFDSDALPGMCKPFRDALQDHGVRLIHSDGPDSGHHFQYSQVVAKPLGVMITVTLAAPRG